MKGEALLAAHKLRKVFSAAAGELTVLEGLELELMRGEMMAVIGESGVGKSTLLYLLAALDRPSGGDVHYGGASLGRFSPDALADYRNRQIGFVWQLANLLPDFTARENVALPLLLRGTRREAAGSAAEHWLAEVGLSDRADHLAGELSGGEQQRVALARALVTQPALLFADELTGNLDEATGDKIFALLQRLHRTHGLTSLIATHNLKLAEQCDRVVRLEKGRLAPVPV